MGNGRDGRSRAFRLLGWAFVGLSLLFLAALLLRQGEALGRLRADLSAFEWRLRPGWLAAAVAVGTVDLFLMAAVWVALFRALGGRCGSVEGVRVWMTTNLGRYLPGKLWQLSGLAVYMRERRGAGAAALSAAALFQVLVLGTGAAVAAAALGGRALRDGAFLPAAILLALTLGVLLRPALVGRLAGALARRLGERPPDVVPGLRSLWGAGLALAAAWVLNGLGLWLVWRGSGGPPAPGPWTLSGVFAASYVAGYVVLFAPGGLVVREGAMAGLLAAVTGVPLGVGVAVSIVARLWTTATELVGLALAWLPAARGGGGRAGEGTADGGAGEPEVPG
ncbi:MAG: lysylphosphatidylglycerol synthase domain-containing protein [Gemmatimonadota bacterium]|jgi:glycosyltransferase 2 family protein